MKKLIMLSLSTAMMFSLAACSSGGSSSSGDTAGGSTAAASGTGSVYYLNFKPEADSAWQELAKTYTEQTGVEVKVVTAASGEYDTTLISELGKSGAPTMFNIGNAGAVATYGDYALDLTGTDVYNEMTTHSFDQVVDGYTYSIGYCYESYGIIVNKALLKEAGYEVTDITNFDSLKKVAEDIHSRASELGFDAFTNSGLDSSSSWRFSGHLANLPLYYTFKDMGQAMNVAPAEINDSYMDNYRAIWDLYINNSTTDPVANNTATGDAAESEFMEGKAVFYQNGTWEYSNLVAKLNAEDLQMIPIYIGVEGEENSALASGTENCWAVNKNASAEDQQATLDFMKWVVTSDEGTKMMAEQFGPIPFKSAATPENVFFADANELLAEGKYNVDWAFNTTPNVDDWRAGVVSALQAYGADQSDANWDAVVDAFVNGWAVQYAAANN